MADVDIDRLTAELEKLATLSDAEAPAVTRVLFTEKDLAARKLLKGLCRDAGLEVREDPIGNTFARWVGSDPMLPAVGTGSHTDAIPHSGRYDGTVGVFGGLEAIRMLQASGFKPRRSIELLMFTAEEPTRYGIGCVGSRAMAGVLDPQRLGDLNDSDGRRLDEVRKEAGFSGSLDKVKLPENYYSHFVELHIEQGPLLEEEGLDIGVVTAIAAPAALRVKLNGSGGHAGAVLMPERRDALCAASEIILAVENAARSTGSPDTVGTVGICEVHPGAINSVPSGVTLTIDVRDVAAEPRDRAVKEILSAIKSTCKTRKVEPAIEWLNSDPPATMAEPILAKIEESCREAGYSSRRMVSRAYHDSLFMARVGPTAMIFIPCYKGYSHRPDEYSSPEAIKKGVDVLARTLRMLAE